MLHIEKNIPIAGANRKARGLLQALRTMDIGDSVLVPLRIGSTNSAVDRASKDGRTYTRASQPAGGTRIWRTA